MYVLCMAFHFIGAAVSIAHCNSKLRHQYGLDFAQMWWDIGTWGVRATERIKAKEREAV